MQPSDTRHRMAPIPSRSDGSPNASPATPYTTTAGRSRNMAAIRRSGTKPDLKLRRALHARGYRYRKDLPVRVNGKLIRPDIAFTRYKIAVFVDGCFWHSCPEHGRRPANNTSYWLPKLARNAARDQEQVAMLTAAGWTVIRLWEHQPECEMVQIVANALAQAKRVQVNR